jgi:hypothetical protein
MVKHSVANKIIYRLEKHKKTGYSRIVRSRQQGVGILWSVCPGLSRRVEIRGGG